MALKGFACNNLTPALVVQFAPDRYWFSWGPWCYDDTALYEPPHGCVAYLYEAIPTVAQLQAMSSKGWYRHWVGVGRNEVDSTSLTPQVEAALIRQQIVIVRAGDPKAKFILHGGSQLHAPENPWDHEIWIEALWAEFNADEQKSFKAIDFNYYPQAELGVNALNIFNKAPLKRNFNAWRRWRNTNAPWLQLFNRENGLSVSDLTLADPRTANQPNIIQLAADEAGIDWWNWYGFENVPGYVNLWSGVMTPTGATFAGVSQ